MAGVNQCLPMLPLASTHYYCVPVLSVMNSGCHILFTSNQSNLVKGKIADRCCHLANHK